MLKLRLTSSVICLALAAATPALANGAVTVNYEALNRLPPAQASDFLTAPKLRPPGLSLSVRPAPLPDPAYAPPSAGSAGLPAVFTKDHEAYNATDARAADDHAALIFGGITGATKTPGDQVASLATSGPERPHAPNFVESSPVQPVSFSKVERLGAVTFESGGVEVMDIDVGSLAELDGIAEQLSGPGARVLLKAFGGMAGDKSHEAHLMALKRGLAVRRYLIAKGVPATRIDVRAFGGATDGGPIDRVDVVMSAS